MQGSCTAHGHHIHVWKHLQTRSDCRSKSLPFLQASTRVAVMATPSSTAVLSLKVVKKHLDTALKAFDDREKNLNKQKTSLQAKIDKEISSLILILGERKKQLLKRLDLLTQHKLQCLSAHKKQVELTRTKMSNLLIEASTGGQDEPKEITVEFDPSTIQPQTEADVVFIKEQVEQLSKACREFGEVCSEQIDIESCLARGDGLKCATAEEVAVVEVDNVSDKLNLAAELVHNRSRATVKCQVGQESGRHTITYKPVSRGKHSLHIRVNEKHIQGSPFPIAVTPSLESLRKPVRIVEGLSKPRGVTTNSKGHLIVAERDSHYVTTITQDGKKRSFGGFGSEKGKFNKPRGVAVDKDDNIYVVDMGNHRIQKFTSDGKFIAAVGSLGSENGQFNLPLGICFNRRKDRLYICDQSNYRVQVFSTNLTFKRAFGGEGSDYGQFNFPENAAFDDSNNLYVTDYYNNRVQVFTADGQFLSAITHKSRTHSSGSPQRVSSGEKLKHPRAVAVDSSNIVYVSEWECEGVSLFSSQGEFIRLLGKGTGGRVDRLYGIAVDQNDCVIVSANNKLEIF